MIKATGLNKYYFSGKNKIHILKDVSLEIVNGSITAIVGPSGAGKSTLLHILGGLDIPDSGEVFFEGRSFSGLPEAALAGLRNTTIGFVFQFYHLLSEFTILENVMMPGLISRQPLAVSRQLKQKALGLLEIVGLGNRQKHLPSQLSGGEQQRAAIARALINEPRLLFCDEPTGNLDSENGRLVGDILKKLNKEKAVTLILVTHNLEVANLAFKVYNIKDGVLR